MRRGRRERRDGRRHAVGVREGRRGDERGEESDGGAHGRWTARTPKAFMAASGILRRDCMTQANPFCAARFAPGVLPWIGEGEVERYLDAVCVPGARHQVIGAHGSGKSTLLVHLERGARVRGWPVVRFRGSTGCALPRRGALILADEAEELGALGRAFLRTFATSLVMTGHRDLGLPLLSERAVDVATLAALVERLAGRAPPHDALAASLERHRGNVRDVFFELYDAFELARRGG
jgi:hypothetical protein